MLEFMSFEILVEKPSFEFLLIMISNPTKTARIKKYCIIFFMKILKTESI